MLGQRMMERLRLWCMLGQQHSVGLEQHKLGQLKLWCKRGQRSV
uniref:Uncharacterized protein n=1 Tax=Tetranychus urticae TaxID=32264 RepID=T1JQP5_TETUR